MNRFQSSAWAIGWAVCFAVGAAPRPAQAMSGKGFIEVAPSKRYFQFEDGTPFFPIGLNEWPDALDTRKKSKKEIEAYFRNLRAHGVNVLRLIVESGKPADNLWVETRPGAFNPAFKAYMDFIVGLAEKYDVYLIVALYPNLVDGPFGNWRFYPYSRRVSPKGLKRPDEMVSNPLAWEYEKRRFRYFVDHWGRSAHIFSWELFNEFWHPLKGVSKKQNLQAHNRWIDMMGRYIKEYEQKKYGRHHLRSVSTMRSEFPGKGARPEDANIYSSPNLDFASYHAYGQTLRKAMGAKGNFGILMGKPIRADWLMTAVHETVQQMQRRAGPRPVLCTEDVQVANPRAPSYKKPMNPVRRMFRGYTDAARLDLFLAANWAYVMSGAAGTTMRYPHGFYEDAMFDSFLALSRFAARVPWSRFSPRNADAQVTTDQRRLLRMALSDGTRLIGWLYDPAPPASRRRIEPAVTFRGLKPGAYRIEWIDTRTGEVLRAEKTHSAPFTAKAPAFRGHIAFVVEKTGP